MSKININGKSYDLGMDLFNITYIGNKPINEFMKTLSDEDTIWLAKRGMKLIQEEPEHFDDIAERLEMPRELKSTMDGFKVNER